MLQQWMEETFSTALPCRKDVAHAVTRLLRPLDANAKELLRDTRLDPHEFEPLHVEPLLTQAAQLLDRCLDYQREFNALRARAIEFAVDDAFDSTLIKCQDDEIAEGVGGLDLASKLADLEWQGLDGATNRRLDVWSLLQSYADRRKRGSPEAEQYVNLGVGSPTHQASRWKQDDELTHANASVNAAMADHAIASAQRAMASARHKYETALIPIQRERLAAVKARRDARRSASNTAGGAMNFLERSRLLEELLAADLAEAYERLLSVESGLRDLYALDTPLPRPTPVGTIEAVILWLRKRLHELVRLGRKESDCVHTLSVRQALGALSDRDWAATLASGKPIEFPVTGSMLGVGAKEARTCCVRFRGLRLYVVPLSQKISTTWQMRISVPRRATVRQPERERRPGADVEIDQSLLPAVHVGDCRPRLADFGEPPFLGAALHNASPFGTDPTTSDGQWRLELRGASLEGTKPEAGIRDIELDLHVAVLDSV